MLVSVILPTHNPDASRLARTLAGLAAQTLPREDWECFLVDNASVPPVESAALPNLRIVREPQLGLTAARRRGIASACGSVLVFVDDDNVLAPDYLAHVVRIFAAHPKLGAIGGRSLPEFDAPPPPWAVEFFPLLALRETVAGPPVSGLRRSPDGHTVLYPECAPIGAGMALRRGAAMAWAERTAVGSPPDRRGAALSSAGDNDIVLTLLHAGWEVGFFPELALTHLVPVARVEANYLARLNRGIQRSWMQVLTRHGANAWPLIPSWTVPLRKMKTWWAHRAWRGPAARIRWQGACGHFEGRIPSERSAK